MVVLHGLEAGVPPPQATFDADALVDVRVVPAGTRRLAHVLRTMGLDVAGTNRDGVGHRFVGRGLSVDVLAPDDLGPRADLTTVPPARTIAVPAGSRLVRSRRRVPVDCDGATAWIPRPDLDAAIVGEAAAMTLAGGGRHRADLAFLLGLVPDPRALARSLTPSDRKWLRRAAVLLDDELVWRVAPDPDAARSTLAFVLRRPG